MLGTKVCGQKMCVGTLLKLLEHPWRFATIMLKPIPKDTKGILSIYILSLPLPFSLSHSHTHYIIFTQCDRMNEVNGKETVAQCYLLEPKHHNTQAADLVTEAKM